MDWVHHMWFVWFWPSLEGNGPEDIIATLGLAAFASLIWPPTRARIHRFIDRKAESIKDHVTFHHEETRAEVAELHRKFDHLLHHSDVPPLPPRDKSEP